MESGTASELRASATASSFFGLANEKSKEMAMDCGLCAGDLLGEGVQFFCSAGAVRISPSLAVRSFDAEAEIFGDQRLDAVEEKIVELGAGLASDFDGVFESGGGDEGGARAFALEQRVGADGGAVEEDEFAVADAQSFVDDLAEGFDDGLRGIGGRGKNFEHAEAACVEPDAVGEGAAGVDGDAERLGGRGIV